MPGISSRRSVWRLGLALAVAACIAQGGGSGPEKAQVKAPPETATKPVPRGGRWMELHERFLETARKGHVDLLFLGDSITQGWGGHNKEGEGPKEVWDRHYGPRNAANFGIGGDRTQHVLWRIENGELEGINPKVVVLMIGTNNAGANSADEIADGIKAIVKTLGQKLPEAKVLLLGVFPRGEKPNPARAKLDAVNDQISHLDDGKRVKYLDIGKRFLNPDGTLSKEVMPDFLHLSRKGYRIWADAIEPTLWSLLDDDAVKTEIRATEKSGG